MSTKPPTSSTLLEILENDEGKITFKEFYENFAAFRMLRMTARLRMWDDCIGLGIAGNVAGHMAQAGEADKSDKGKEQKQPTAVFPFFVPHAQRILDRKKNLPLYLKEELERLKQFPVTNKVIDFPSFDDDRGFSKVQVEPELALYCDIIYEEDALGRKLVVDLVPKKFAAFNDCSIRVLSGASRLSEKKNWGMGSKGISYRTFECDGFCPRRPDGLPTIASRLWITSYVKREGRERGLTFGKGQIHKYTIAAPARNYLLYYQDLLEWVTNKLNAQNVFGGESGRFEDLHELLLAAGHPNHAWISLGAGEYTEWGNSNYLDRGDEAVVIVYDEFVYGVQGPGQDLVKDIFNEGLRGQRAPGMCTLHQTVV